MTNLCKVSALIWLLGCVHAPLAPASRQHSHGTAHYTVTIFDNLGGARVRACIEGATVRELVPIDDSAAQGLRGAWIDGDAIVTAGGRFHLSQRRGTSCVEYETRFGGLMFRANDSSVVMLSQTEWLWRPDPFPPGLETSLRFVLPAGAGASLPWPRSDATYFPDESAFFANTYSVFGSFDREAFSVAGTSIDVTRLGSRPSDENIHRWLGRAVQVAASVGGRFPRDRIHFVIVPVHSTREPVVFGMVFRGGGAAILLLPSLDATVGQLETDWVAIHELSHLWLPRLYPQDRWLSEGIATYLQEVLRARCGLQTGEHAWTRLEDGLERGRRSGHGRPLTIESRDMHRSGAYRRVYWAGVAFALEADVHLRTRSNGEMTLLRAINEAQHVWGAEARPVGAPVLLQALDAASGAGFLEALAEKYAASPEFPDTAYLDSPAYREVRAEIMSRDDEACRINAESSR